MIPRSDTYEQDNKKSSANKNITFCIRYYERVLYNLLMLRLSSDYHNRNILSLRTGQPIGHAYSPVINPDNLKIEGWYASSVNSRDPKVLPAGEIRDIIKKGLVVNDHDSVTDPEDLVRMKSVLEVNYELIGKSVVTEGKSKLGKIQDYSVDDKSMYVQKLYVNQSLLKGISRGQILIDRSQIIELNDKKIIVKDNTEKSKSERSVATAPAL
jgi:uncharacterized protein YrrD